MTCTYTNTKRGKIIIEKQTLPDGSPQLFTFTRSYGANVQLSDGQQNDSGFLAPGTLLGVRDGAERLDPDVVHVRRRLEPELDLLQAGETVKCTFNNAQNGQVIVKKVMVGGTDSFATTGTPAGVDRGQQRNDLPGGRSRPVHLDRGGEGRLGPDLDRLRRRQLVRLAGEPAGDLQRRGRRDRDLHLHEHEAGPGHRQEGHGRRHRHVLATREHRRATSRSNDGTISADVAPGQHVSTEAAKAGWDLTGVVCDDANSIGSVANRQATFNVEAGETVTCTFTNRKQGQVIVKKVMVGGTDTFTYTGTPAGSISAGQWDDLRERRSGRVRLGRGREVGLGAHVDRL